MSRSSASTNTENQLSKTIIYSFGNSAGIL